MSRFWIVFLILCFVLPTWVYLYTPRGGVITVGDSITYIAAARSLQSGQDPVQHNGSPLVRWPPLYPALVASSSSLGALFNFDIFASIQLLNYVNAVLTLITVGILLHFLLYRQWLIFLGMGLIALSWPYFVIHIHAWSETAFVLIVLIFLLTLTFYLHTGRSTYLMGSILFATCASMQRYAGITAIITGTLAITLLSSHQRWYRRALSAVLFVFITSLPLGLWFFRNHLVTGTVAGGWSPLDSHIPGTIERWLRVLGGWFTSDPTWVATAIGGVVILLIFWAGITSVSNRHQDRALRQLLLLILIGYVLIFHGFTLLTGIFTRAEISDRILISVFFISMILVTVGLDRWLRLFKPDKRVALALISLGVIYMIAIRTPKLRHEYPILSTWCCRDLTWEKTELIQWLNSNDLAGELWTNDIDRASLYVGIYPQALPRNFNEEWFENWEFSDDSYLIWFSYDNDVRYDYENLSPYAELTSLQSYDNGIIFTIRPTQ